MKPVNGPITSQMNSLFIQISHNLIIKFLTNFHFLFKMLFNIMLTYMPECKNYEAHCQVIFSILLLLPML
jgi:hypothetical protein